MSYYLFLVYSFYLLILLFLSVFTVFSFFFWKKRKGLGWVELGRVKGRVDGSGDGFMDVPRGSGADSLYMYLIW